MESRRKRTGQAELVASVCERVPSLNGAIQWSGETKSLHSHRASERYRAEKRDEWTGEGSSVDRV